MAKRSKPSVLKRERERKRAEKAAMKRDQRTRRDDRPGEGEDAAVASRSELESYGALVGPGAADDAPRRTR
jgi:hypothetical protein